MFRVVPPPIIRSANDCIYSIWSLSDSYCYLRPQGRSGQVRKISPLPGFDPRTVQPVASRYTDYATRPTLLHKVKIK